jgi:hypothetical protein
LRRYEKQMGDKRGELEERESNWFGGELERMEWLGELGGEDDESDAVSSAWDGGVFDGSHL